jgi:hypothetical protein
MVAWAQHATSITAADAVAQSLHAAVHLMVRTLWRFPVNIPKFKPGRCYQYTFLPFRQLALLHTNVRPIDCPPVYLLTGNLVTV